MSSEVELYYCPMKCEDEKTYTHPGRCPVCGMHLVKVGAENKTQQISKENSLPPLPTITRKNVEYYYCPMLCEDDKKYLKPGDCPVCGMHLVKEQNPELVAHAKSIRKEAHSYKHTTAPKTNKSGGDYYCPMLCEADN